MIKNLSLTILFSLCNLYVFAQNTIPQTINYQGIARNQEGRPLTNKDLLFKIQIFTNDVVDYFETRTIKTNSLGAFSFQIGDANTITSSSTNNKPFSQLNWGLGQKSFNINFSTDNGNTYLNGNKLLISSVPYALHALKSTIADDISIKVNNLESPNTFNVPTTQAVVDYVKDISGIDIKNMILADGTVPMNASLNLKNQKIINLATPTNPNDAVNKAYTDEKINTEAPNSVSKALSNADPNTEEKNLQDAVKKLIKNDAEDITQNDQLNNFITLNQGNNAKGAVLTPVQIGFDKNSLNKAVAIEVLARVYDHDNNAQTTDTNPLTDAINSLNPWKNDNNKTAAKVNFNFPVTNFAGVQTSTGLQVNTDLTVKVGNLKNAGIEDYSNQNTGSLNAYHVSSDGNGNLSAYQGQIEPVKIVSTNTALNPKDYLIYAKGNITISLPSTKDEGRINGRMYQITALTGDVTLSESYKSIVNFNGSANNIITAGNSVKIIFVADENAWIEVK